VTWLGPTTRAYALCAAVDMRKGFDGLFGLATQALGRDVLRGEEGTPRERLGVCADQECELLVDLDRVRRRHSAYSSSSSGR